MVTLAISQMLYLLFSKSKGWGGADGLRFSFKPDFGFGEISSPTAVFYMVAVFFILAYFLLRLFVDSPFGKALKGVMQNENRMMALGYNINVYKLVAYVFAGMWGSIAGVLAAFKNQFVSPDLFALHVSTEVMLMVFIGGLGTLIGPVIGAGVFIVLQNWVSTLTERWPLIMGLLFIFIVLFVKGGVLQMIKTVLTKLGLLKISAKEGNPVESAES